MNLMRQKRQAAGLSLQKLADAVGSSKAYMWQLENKKDPQPTIRLAFRISRALGVGPEQIFDTT